jgi:hypothetical protein
MNLYHKVGDQYTDWNINFYKSFDERYDVKHFKCDEKIISLLEKTDFNHNAIKMPYDVIALDINYKDKFGYEYPKIYIKKLPDGIKIVSLHTLKEDSGSLLEFAVLELTDELKPIKAQVDKKEWEDYKPGLLDEAIYHEDLLIKFIGNFLNLINSPDLDFVYVKTSQEQNQKRMNRGKLPRSDIVFIRLKGKVKEYVDSLDESDFSHSHMFWVRGHWRVLRSDFWKESKGNVVWILPYIKGSGELINKRYIVE